MITGADAQNIGDGGEDQVCAALTGDGFVVNVFRRDVGEDLLVELGGRAVALVGAPPPRQAYLQVKAHQALSEGDCHSQNVERKQLVRWAFQRIPVFLVVVTGSGPTRRFFLRAIDEYLAENPGSLAPACEQNDFAIRTDYQPTLADALREAITQFYRSAVYNLAQLDEVDVQNTHVEFVSQREDLYPVALFPRALVRIDSWKALYKSEPRPANLRAVVDFIAARARQRVGGGPRAARVWCFLYSSMAARHANQWIARVTWSESHHPGAPSEWATEQSVEVKTNPRAVEAQRFLTKLTASALAFDEYLRPLAVRADALAERALCPTGDEVWSAVDVEELRMLEAAWNDGPHAPAQLHHVGVFFAAFLDGLESHRWAARDVFDATARAHARVRKYFGKLNGFRGAVPLLLDQAAAT